MPRKKKLPSLDLDKIRKIKRHWIEISFVLALIIPFIAGLVVTDWSIYSDALSDFGTHPGTAFITEIFRGLHGLVAATFFISYMVFIFMYGFWQLESKLKEGAVSVVAGLLLLLTSLLIIPFKGLAIFEIAYVLIIVAWNYIIHKKNRIEKMSKMFINETK